MRGPVRLLIAAWLAWLWFWAWYVEPEFPDLYRWHVWPPGFEEFLAGGVLAPIVVIGVGWWVWRGFKRP